jgi:Uma2 family endonuclease
MTKTIAAVTWTEFLRLDEDDLRELIDGVLLEVEVPDWLHERIVTLLSVLLDGWARSRRAGRVVGSGYKVRISLTRGVMPDVQLYRAENPDPPGHAGLEKGRPDLVVEVISPSSRRYDRVVKCGWYAEIGVPEYWLVDPQARTLERLRLVDGRYVTAESLRDGEVFRPDTFPGLEIALRELWEG